MVVNFMAWQSLRLVKDTSGDLGRLWRGDLKNYIWCLNPFSLALFPAVIPDHHELSSFALSYPFAMMFLLCK